MILNFRKLLFFLLLFISGITAAVMLFIKSAPVFSGMNDYIVVLDAGHGTPDGGAVGFNGTKEKDINLDIVLKLKEILESRGIKVVLTRNGDNAIYDSDAKTIHEMKISDMHNRKQIINSSDADLFLSIHMNAFHDKNSSGLRIFYANNHPEGQKKAESIQNSISSVTKCKCYTIKTASESLYLMKNPKPCAILIECGFITNPQEEKLLNTDEYRAKIAYGIADAVCNNK